MPSTYSPLRYPGGKTKLYDYVYKLLEANELLGETYVEPFAGGAGLAIKLLLKNDVKRIVINDFDPAIYAFWYCVLNQADELCNLIEQTEVTVRAWEQQKAIYEDQKNHTQLDVAFATFFLNRTNVSGVIKGGIIGGIEQTGTYGISARYTKATSIQKIQAIAGRKEQIILSNMDVFDFLKSESLQSYRKTFINFDPPYVKKGAKLYKNAFAEADHRNLSALIRKCKRKWIVTYDICPLIAALYEPFRRSELDITYSINGSHKAKEYIFFSPNLTLPENIQLK